MPRSSNALVILTSLLTITVALPACSPGGSRKHEKLGPPERFDWVAQTVEFSPPPAEWRREGDNGGGLLGVRFILTNGGGQVMSVAAYRQWSEKLPRKEIVELLAELDSLELRELPGRLARLRVQLTDPLTADEERAAFAVNEAVNRAESDLLAGRLSFVRGDVQEALQAVDAFKPSLDELLPRMRLEPGEREHPDWRVLGHGVDTTLAGLPAYVSNDTLALPEQKLLYRQVFWVVDGTAFQAIYQGRAENQHVFEQMVQSIRFPGREPHAPN